MTNRLFTRTVQFYLAGKFIDNVISKTREWAKDHKIDFKNLEGVTKNLFDCMKSLN